MISSIALILSAASAVCAAPTSIESTQNSPRAVTFPFNKVVAFGDDFTDNSQGSYAHGITGNETTGANKNLWGAGTWTDGLVPVSYLSNSLRMNLTYDYAFGSSEGAQYIGSVCDTSLVNPSQLNAYATLLNGNVVPDALSQIKNYTTKGVFNKKIGQTLHFFWTGNNDMIASLYTGGRFPISSTPKSSLANQTVFISQVMGCMNSSLSSLIAHGAKHIFVPNVYPRNLAPWTTQYITQDAATIANFGTVISTFNAKLQALTASLSAKYSVNVIYYDANTYLTKAMATPSMVQGATYNYTCVDGCPAQIPGYNNFNLWYTDTLIGKKPDNFTWMTTVMPTTTVLKALAGDMLTSLTAHYA